MFAFALGMAIGAGGILAYQNPQAVKDFYRDVVDYVKSWRG